MRGAASASPHPEGPAPYEADGSADGGWEPYCGGCAQYCCGWAAACMP